MDNNFCENRSQRRNQKNEKVKNYMVRIITVQLILSLLITGIIFGVCKTETQLSQNIKSYYAEISKRDIMVTKLFDQLKNVVKQTFSPNIQEETISETEVNVTGEKVGFSPFFI